MAQRIPKEFIDLLLEKSNIVDVINQFIKIDKDGREVYNPAVVLDYDYTVLVPKK